MRSFLTYGGQYQYKLNRMNLTIDIKNARNTISEYRTLMMGLAILWIMLFHQYWLSSVFPKISPLSACGLWGVEVFLFLSGIGISHSLDKNPTKVYFKNRFLRIIPIVLVVELLSLCIDCMGWDILPNSIVVYFGGIHIWYVKAIIVYYLIAPFLHKYITKYASVLFVSSVIIYLSSLLIDFKILMPERIIARIPVFIMGMTFAKCKIKMNYMYLLLSYVVYIMAIWLNITGKLSYGHDFCLYPIAILFGVPALIYIFVLISKLIKLLHFDVPFTWLGKRTLELYLWNESMYIIMGYYDFSPLVKLSIALGLTFIFAEISHWLAIPLINYCKNFFKRY